MIKLLYLLIKHNDKEHFTAWHTSNSKTKDTPSTFVILSTRTQLQTNIVSKCSKAVFLKSKKKAKKK